MTFFDWVALVGAAAWIPQIIGTAYRVLTKPRVSVIPVRQIEVGYNVLGPILNVKAALFAEQKDATVIDMQLILIHEKGRTVQLGWHSFMEKFSELHNRDGETIEVSRDQEATALRLSTSLPVEKFIRFQDSGFQEQARVLTNAALNEINRVHRTDATPGNFVHAKEYVEFMRFFRHQFCWEVGGYDLELKIQLLERRSPLLARSHFVLSESDVEMLQENVELLDRRLQQIAAKVPEDQRVSPSNFATPSLTSNRIMVRR